MIIFITGGVRSGKSDFAQELAERREGKRLFLATAQALDAEMEERIRKHREKRGTRWETLEEPVHIGKALQSVAGSYKTILVDCLTVWMSNLFMEYPDHMDERMKAVDEFIESFDGCDETIIIVSNEVGLGIVPDNPLARSYRDELGFLNQRMARHADTVYMLVAGIPLKIKG